MLVKMQWSLRSTCLLWYILVPMVGTVLPIYQRDNVWRQDRPSSDNLFSLSSGNVWQDQPSLDPLRPFHTGNVWRQEPFSDSYFGGAWQQWSSLDSPSHDQPSYSSQLMFSTPFGNKRYRDMPECSCYLNRIAKMTCAECREYIKELNLPQCCCGNYCLSP